MGENKLNYEISKRYSHELSDIANKLTQLENNRVYELSGAKMDGYLSTNVAQLRKMFAELLSKIQDDEEGFNERIGKMIR